MTKFAKEMFQYHGGFLMYHGQYEGQPTYGEVYGAEKCHPSRIDMPKELFVARFKYSKAPITKAKFLKELIKNHTVEGYAKAIASGKAPIEVLREKNPAWYEGIMNAFK